MILRTIALAAIAATSIGAQAALTIYQPWADYWPQGTVGQGIDNVQFNVQTSGGVTVAMGAHGYMNGETLPNDGVSTYYAKKGVFSPDLYTTGPLIGQPKNYANWSFDFAVDMSGKPNCTSCTVQLLVDTDPTAGVTPFDLFNNAPAQTGMDSWNMEMSFMPTALGGYNFNPFGDSSTEFTLRVLDAGRVVASSTITVNVPEPGSLALVGLALAGLAGLRRSKA